AFGGCTFARVNTRDGGFDVVQCLLNGWVAHDGGDDVAATSIEFDGRWAVTPLEWENVFGDTKTFSDRLRELNFGVGDEAVMVGRFVGHDGRERNLPLARFGNFAMMPA